MQLGDMLVSGEYSLTMLKALATIAMRLHPAYDELADKVRVGHSKESCLFSSLAVRDFLVSVGFADATVRPCTVVMHSQRAGEELWSLGIGMPGDKRNISNKFAGHAVVVVPSENILIDPTLYQALRPQWHGALPGMMALELDLDSPCRVHELAQIASYGRSNGDLLFIIQWGDRPDIIWRRQPDVTDPRVLARRRRIAKALREGWP